VPRYLEQLFDQYRMKSRYKLPLLKILTTFDNPMNNNTCNLKIIIRSTSRHNHPQIHLNKFLFSYFCYYVIHNQVILSQHKVVDINYKGRLMSPDRNKDPLVQHNNLDYHYKNHLQSKLKGHK